MKYGIVGASGKMGKEVISVFGEDNKELVFSFVIQGEWKQSDPEILIDCSLPEAFEKMIELAKNFNAPLIVATTGLTENNLNQLKKFAQIKPVVQSYARREAIRRRGFEVALISLKHKPCAVA